MDQRKEEQTAARRALEARWNKITDVGQTVKCKWLDPLVEGEQAEAEFRIDGKPWGLLVEPEIGTIGGKVKRRTRDYQAYVEKIATWRWHTARGTPVDERDHYLTEPNYKPPTFVWEEAPAKPIARAAA